MRLFAIPNPFPHSRHVTSLHGPFCSPEALDYFLLLLFLLLLPSTIMMVFPLFLPPRLAPKRNTSPEHKALWQFACYMHLCPFQNEEDEVLVVEQEIRPLSPESLRKYQEDQQKKQAKDATGNVNWCGWQTHAGPGIVGHDVSKHRRFIVNEATKVTLDWLCIRRPEWYM